MGAVLAHVKRFFVGLWRGVTHYPRELIAQIRANPSRAVAIAWVAGMCVFGWFTFRRAWRLHEEAVAREAAAPKLAAVTPRRLGGPEVVQMLDVDEMDQIRTDRFHALGLAAAGEAEPPSAEQVAKAREARGKTVEAEGARVGGKDVIVVAKGGIAGWVKRNKDKKPDPETLAWLRKEEAAEGRAAYAEWAEGGNSIEAWLERGKKRREAGLGKVDPMDDPAVREAMEGIDVPRRAGTGSAGGGSAGAGTGTATAMANGAVGTTSPNAPTAGTGADATAPGAAAAGAHGPNGTTGAGAVGTAGANGATGTVGAAGGDTGGAVAATARPIGVDVELLGMAALAEIDAPTRARFGARPADLEALDATIRKATITKQVDVAIRERRLVVTLPVEDMFAADNDLALHGEVVVRQLAKALATVTDYDFLVTARDPEQALTVAAQIAIAGVVEGRLAIGVNPSPAVEIIMLPGGAAP